MSEIIFDPATDHWEHPVQMIMSAERVEYVNKEHRYARCMHTIGARRAILRKFDMISEEGQIGKAYYQLAEGYTTCEAFTITLNPYMFDYSEDTGFRVMAMLGLCSCGVLYVGKRVTYKIVMRDCYGHGNHHWTEIEG